jgi:hypothetical protein
MRKPLNILMATALCVILTSWRLRRLAIRPAVQIGTPCRSFDRTTPMHNRCIPPPSPPSRDSKCPKAFTVDRQHQALVAKSVAKPQGLGLPRGHLQLQSPDRCDHACHCHFRQTDGLTLRQPYPDPTLTTRPPPTCHRRSTSVTCPGTSAFRASRRM